MIIRNKGMVRNSYDAPFVGVLLSAIDCHINCAGCINAWLHDKPIVKTESDEIFKLIEDDKFIQGIIFAGLEWTEQYDELIFMLNETLNRGFKAMLYTGLSEDFFKEKFPDIYALPIYIKFGQYIDSSVKRIDNGIMLASHNQYIRNNTKED